MGWCWFWAKIDTKIDHKILLIFDRQSVSFVVFSSLGLIFLELLFSWACGYRTFFFHGLVTCRYGKINK